jgi:integrase/recombinase XerD
MTTQLQIYITQFLQAKRLKSKNTQEFYEKGLRFYSAAYPDWPITDINITNFLFDVLERGCKPSTVHCYFRAIRTFCNWLHKRKLITDNPVELVDAPKLPFLLPRSPEHKVIETLFNYLSNLSDWFVVRDRAILAVAIDTGMRISEIANLELSELDLAAKTILIKQSKTTRQRLVVFHTFTQNCLAQWLALRGAVTFKAVFISGRNGRMIGVLTRFGISLILRRRLSEAGLQHFRFHDLRHAYAIFSLQNGASLLDVQKQLGHASIATTNVYTQLIDTGRFERHQSFSPVGGL